MKEIPLGFRLNGKDYVVWSDNIKGMKGYSQPATKEIWVSTRDTNGNKYSRDERFQTFWHELVHCIVYEMERTVLSGWRDEVWVSQFSELLNEAITTARFK